MTFAPSKLCAHPGCSKRAVTGEIRCAAHLEAQRQHEAARMEQYDAQRGTANERGYDGKWRKIRKVQLRREPLCRICAREGRVTGAAVVHHIDEDARNNRDENLMSVCRDCHERLHGRAR